PAGAEGRVVADVIVVVVVLALLPSVVVARVTDVEEDLIALASESLGVDLDIAGVLNVLLLFLLFDGLDADDFVPVRLELVPDRVGGKPIVGTVVLATGALPTTLMRAVAVLVMVLIIIVAVVVLTMVVALVMIVAVRPLGSLLVIARFIVVLRG